MAGADYIALFTRPLDEAGLTYMVTGATAAIVYGKPRYTNDVDIVIVLPTDAALKLHAAFSADHYYVPPVATIQAEAARNATASSISSTRTAATRRTCILPARIR